MLYCPKCSLEYPEGKKFCKNCGSSLLVRETVSVPENKTLGVLEATVQVKKITTPKKYCSGCKIEYPSEKKFCKTCGGTLAEMTAPLPKTEIKSDPVEAYVEAATKTPPAIPEASEQTQRKFCPSCGTEIREGQRFCKNCGVSFQTNAGPDIPKQPIHKPPRDPKFIQKPQRPAVVPTAEIPARSQITSLLLKKKKLLKAGERINLLISNLNSQREFISEEALKSTLGPYETQREAIQKELDGIDKYLEYIEIKFRTESENLGKELRPYQNRLDELKTMKKAKGLTSGDYKKFKREPHQAFKHLGSQIKKRDRILKVLTSSPSRTNLMFDPSVYLKIGVLIVAIVFLGAGGFFGYTYLFKKDKDLNVSKIQSGQSLPPSTPSPAAPAASAEEEIKSVFETIKQANMTKDINLFMNCYSTAFPNLEEKKAKTIQTWKDMDITGLTYVMRDLIAQENTAEVNIDWQINTRSAENGQTETFNTTNNVVLQKEGGQWKIVNLK